MYADRIAANGTAESPVTANSQETTAVNISVTPAPVPPSKTDVPIDSRVQEAQAAQSQVPCELSISVARPNGTWPTILRVPIRRDKAGNARLLENPVWSLSNPGSQMRKHPEASRGMVKARARRCQGLSVCPNAGCHGPIRPLVRPSAEESPSAATASANERRDGPSRTTVEQEGGTRSEKRKRRQDTERRNGQSTCRLCGTVLQLTPCPAVFVIAVPESDDVECEVWHIGYHQHEIPPLRTVPAAAAAELRALSAANPDLTPAQLRIGRDVLEPNRASYRKPAISIDPRFANLRAISEVTKPHSAPPRLSKRDPTYPGTLATAVLAEFSAARPNTCSDLAYEDNTFSFSIATPSMRAVAAAGGDTIPLRAALRRSGLVTDTHNTFFAGTWRLIATVAFDIPTSRWVPVLWTVTSRENAVAYRRHFNYLFDILSDAGLSSEDILQRVLSVFDFSASQTSGFDQAFAQWFSRASFGEATRVADIYSERLRAQALVPEGELDDPEVPSREAALSYALDESTVALVEALKHHLLDYSQKERYDVGLKLAECSRRGCLRHFEASVGRIARSKRGPGATSAEWSRLAMKLSRVTSVEEHQEVCERLHTGWPHLDWWLNWWSRPYATGMLVPARRDMGPADVLEVPETSNAVESSHRLLIVSASGKKFSLEVGLRRLSDFASGFELMRHPAGKFMCSP